MNAREIAHHWAHQTRPRGRSGNVSFTGPDLFSYSATIARIVERKGRKVYLLSQRTYSVTTAKHISWAAGAVPGGADILRVPDLGYGHDNPRDWFDYSVKQAADCEAKAERARTAKAFHTAEALRWMNQVQLINDLWGLRRKVDAQAISRLTARAAAQAAELEKRQVEAYRQAELDAADKISRWLAGEDVTIPRAVGGVYLRVVGEEMETSLGARVPLADARLAWRFIAAHRGQSWRRNGEQCPVGDFQLDAINELGIVAGCHRVTWAEIDRFAAVVGWTA